MRVELSATGLTPVALVLPRADTPTTTVAAVPITEAPKEGPNPILPVGGELISGAVTFVLLFLIIRLYAFPKVRNGMRARDALIRANLDAATAATAGASGEAASYEAGLAAARGEGAGDIDAARKRLDDYRSLKMGEANARIAERRAEVTAEIDRARTAAMAGMEDAVLDVAVSASERILDRPVDREAQRDVVRQVMAGAEVAR